MVVSGVKDKCLGDSVSILVAAGLVATAFLTALAALTLFRAFELRDPKSRGQSLFSDRTSGTVFLFDGEALVDLSPSARSLLSSIPGPGEPLARLHRFLAPPFPELAAQIATLPERGRLELVSDPAMHKTTLLSVEERGGLMRLALAEPGGAPETGPDPFTFAALQREVEDLRTVVAEMPSLCWREDAAGDIIWSNTAYLLMAAEALRPEEELGWPLPRLFDRTATNQNLPGQRARIALSDRRELWFQLESGVGEASEGIFFATPIDALVQAETSRKETLQTVSKTFAHLPIGVAVFDQHRQLRILNPALLDLTRLPAEMLMSKTSLISFLDALREARILPEPKDYKSWREALVNMERAASEGLYQETWHLPDGQVFRVSGRPYADGGLMLMFEDVSTETMRARRYRADLELGQSVIDSMEEAIAVFSREGQLVMTNAHYSQLWGRDGAEELGVVPVGQLAIYWQSLTAPGARWSEVEAYVSMVGNRVPWDGEARLKDGRALRFRCAPLAAGATLVAFSVLTCVTEEGLQRPSERKQRRG